MKSFQKPTPPDQRAVPQTQPDQRGVPPTPPGFNPPGSGNGAPIAAIQHASQW